MIVKNLIRNLLIRCKIPVTKNLKYDILTTRFMKRILKHDSSCVDVGGFKGEIMEEILRIIPAGGGGDKFFIRAWAREL